MGGQGEGQGRAWARRRRRPRRPLRRAGLHARAAEPPAPPPRAQEAAPPSAHGAASGRRRVAVFAWGAVGKEQEAQVAFHVRESAAALQRAGEEVHVFAPGVGALTPGADGVCYHRCGVPTAQDAVLASTEFCERAAQALRKELSAGGPFAVAHGYGWGSAAALRRAREAGVARTAITFDSTEYERAGQRFESGASETIRRLERNAVHAADRIIAASEEVRRQLLWLYETPPEKVWVIHAGIGAQPPAAASDAAAVKAGYGIGGGDPLLVFVGDLSAEMGPDLLLSAIPAALRTAPKARFLFVGDGPLREPLEEHARRAGAAGAARFTGHMTGEPLWQILCACDAAVFPCRTAKPLATVLYVWSAGKPVIVTHTGPAEFVWHDVTGLKVYPHGSSLAWGLQRVLQDQDFARWMGRNARTAVEEAFTWDAVARKLKEVYWG